MPARRRRSTRTRIEATPSDIGALECGRDFFNDSQIGTGNGGINHEAAAQLWQDPAVRERTYRMTEERQRRGHTRTQPWAAGVFGE